MDKIKGSLYALTATSIFAVNFVSMKVLVGYIPSMLLIGLRFVFAGFFLLFINILLRNSFKIKNKKDLKEFFITGFFGMSFYYIFFTFALKYISASLASLLCSMIPILTAIIYPMLYKKKLELNIILALIISIFGVYLAIDLDIIAKNPANLIIGILLMLVAISGWIYYTIRIEIINSKYNPLILLMYQSLAGGIINCFLSFFQLKEILIFFQSDFPIYLVKHMLFISILGSAIGYYFFNLGIKYLGVTISSAYNNVMPGITLVTSYFLLNTPMSTRKILGILIVIFVTFFITFQNLILKKINYYYKKIA